jgi:ABC-type polysaccharide/polyol phosphate export permease
MFEQYREIWKRRELLFYLVTYQIKADFKNKALGFLWSFLDPLLLLGTYIVLVVVIFDRGEPQFPVLLFCALLAWRWFTSSLGRSVTAVSSKVKVVQTTRFPLAVLPLVIIATGLFDYLTGLIILLPMLFVFDATWTVNVLWLPILLLIQLVGTVGASLICAVIGTYLSDWGNIVQFGLRLWFFLSPILYSVEDRIPEKYETIFWLNPFSALLESYKNILVRGEPPSDYMFIPAAMAVIVFLFGSWYFAREERKLVKAV